MSKKVVMNNSNTALTAEMINQLIESGFIIPGYMPEANSPKANAPKANAPKANAPKANAPEAKQTFSFNFVDFDGEHKKGHFFAYLKSEKAFAIVGEDTKQIADVLRGIGVWNRFTKERYISTKKVNESGDLLTMLNNAMNETKGLSDNIKLVNAK